MTIYGSDGPGPDRECIGVIANQAEVIGSLVIDYFQPVKRLIFPGIRELRLKVDAGSTPAAIAPGVQYNKVTLPLDALLAHLVGVAGLRNIVGNIEDVPFSP